MKQRIIQKTVYSDFKPIFLQILSQSNFFQRRYKIMQNGVYIEQKFCVFYKEIEFENVYYKLYVKVSKNEVWVLLDRKNEKKKYKPFYSTMVKFFDCVYKCCCLSIDDDAFLLAYCKQMRYNFYGV